MQDDNERTELLATRAPHAAGDVAATLPPGARLGRYRIEALLGSGGMGDVYRAEQLEPVRRTVALKLLRAKKLDARHLAYFEVERQLLAQMQHPAIARIFDADTTPDGHPYFAMEFIDGSPVTRWCDERGLGLRQRLELFIRVCEGVQHAHQKGVVHRDLKPANVLVEDVDGRGMPRIIDFGIATTSAFGTGNEVAGTPDYMSPEQAGGDQSLVDTRSDVYALGVLLCELLTGQRPAFAGETVTDRERSLRLPSEQLSTLSPEQAGAYARTHGQDAARVRRQLRGELDWVVAKAMRHDRNQRYASASALADDLHRYLEDRPLQAVPYSRHYAWRKYGQRHRAGIAAAVFAVLALLGGLGLSVYGLLQARAQRTVAEQRSAQLEKVAAFQQSMLEQIDIEAMGVGLAGDLRQQLQLGDADEAAAIERGLARTSTADIARGLVDRDVLRNAELAITRDFEHQPVLAADLREAVAKVRMALGLPEQAAQGFAQVASQREKALGLNALASLQARQLQAEALLAATKSSEALALAEAALDAGAALAADDPLRIRLECTRADAIALAGDRQRAREALEALYQRVARLRGEHDEESLRVGNSLAILRSRMGEPKAGRELLERMATVRIERDGKEHADTLALLHNLAVSRILTDDKQGAVSLQRDLVRIQTRRLGAEHPQTLAERGNLANMLNDSDQHEEALVVGEAVVEARTRVLGAEHPQTLRAKLNLATFHARLEHFDQAIALQEDVAEARTRLLGAEHPDTLFIQINRAFTLFQAERVRDALVQLDRFLPIARRVLGDRHPQVQGGYDIRGQAAEALGQRSLAIESFREVLAMRESGLGRDDPRTVDAAWRLERLLRKRGERQAADELRAGYVQPLLDAELDGLSELQRDKREQIIEAEREEAGGSARIAVR